MSEFPTIEKLPLPVSLVEPVLFGRGAWEVNGAIVAIEIPGWYRWETELRAWIPTDGPGDE